MAAIIKELLNIDLRQFVYNILISLPSEPTDEMKIYLNSSNHYDLYFLTTQSNTELIE